MWIASEIWDTTNDILLLSGTTRTITAMGMAVYNNLNKIIGGYFI